MLARLSLAVLMTCAGAQVLAQDMVEAVTAGRASIKVFSDPEGTKPEPEVKTAGLKFPIRVLERTPNGFLRIKFDSQDPAQSRTAWAESTQFKMSAAHAASCLHRDKSAVASATAVTRGANSSCK